VNQNDELKNDIIPIFFYTIIIFFNIL